MTRFIFLTMLLLAAPSTAATLKAVPAKLNPVKAYILVEYRLMLNPMADMPGSRKRLPLTAGMSFARYDAELGDIRGLGKAKDHPLPKGAETFEGFKNREIVRAEESRLHLIEVDPDNWVIAGWGATSFALGSYSFHLEPGTVTDLGVVTADVDWAEGDKPPTFGDIMSIGLLGPFAKPLPAPPIRASFRPRTTGDIAVPASLAPLTQPVVFTTNQKFANFTGGLVDRIEGANLRLRNSTTAATSTPTQ